MTRKNALVDLIGTLSPAGVAKRARVEAVTAAQPVSVTFKQGRSATLDMTDRRAAAWAEILDSLRESEHPVYVELDPDTDVVTELLVPVTFGVGTIERAPAGDLVVQLGMSSGPHYLRKANPDFKKLLAALRKAAQEGSRVVVTETMDEHEIIDVREQLAHPPTPAAIEAPAPPARRARAKAAITLARAEQLFDAMAARTCDPVTAPAPCIPFMYPDDGCWARASEMCRLMLDMGETPEKIWIYATTDNSLSVRTPNNPSCQVSWRYHVAPIVRVSTGSGTEVYVIDPSMFSEPVPQAVWEYAQRDPTHTIAITGPDVYYRSSSGSELFDPTYADTAANLITYRNQLKNRSATFGPPPYASCQYPDIFIRDNLQDEGLEPLVGGGISTSPDINHYRQELTNAQTTLGSAAAMGRGDMFEDVEKGQSNYLYVRLQNRGQVAGDAVVDLYWMPPSTLPTPTSWNSLGSMGPTTVAPGDVKVVGPLEWSSVPNEGHYCFVAVLGSSPHDPKPDLSAITTIDDFYNLIRNSNNVTWKNFDVTDQFSGGLMHFDFEVRGWPRIAYPGDLELDLATLPPGSEVTLRIVKRLTAQATLERLQIGDETAYHVTLRATSAALNAIRAMPLRASDCSLATLTVQLPETVEDGMYELSVAQRIKGQEVGRITRRLVVGNHPYVANRRSHEIHIANCDWVDKMSGRNKIAYRDLQLALRRGYNGCRFCLPEYSTD